jgi:NADH dehydrogenase
VFITGVRGFIGSSLACHLTAQGHEVYGSTSRNHPVEKLAQVPNLTTLDLRDPVLPETLEAVDAVFHCAHDFSAGQRVNHDGTVAVARGADRFGVKRQVFVSSHSARPDAVSEYGRSKYALEQFFLEQKQLVVRPGLVAGGGGLFGRMIDRLLKARVVPLIAGGRDQVALVGVEDLCEAVCEVVFSEPDDPT